MGLRAGAMRRYRIFETRGYYIYIIYTPNLGFAIAVLGREREQGRFKRSSEQVVSEYGRVSREHAGVQREHGERGRVEREQEAV